MRAMKFAVVLGTAALGAGAIFAGATLRAADHGDSTRVRTDTRSDINDLYIFASPETQGNTVMIMTVCPVAGITAPAQFTPKVKYQFAVDTSADAIEDQVYTMVFGTPNAAGAQTFMLTGPNKLKVKGTTSSTVTVGTGGKVFAGLKDDPFFFDLIAFRRGLAFQPAGKNFFDGLNTMAIVLEVPTSSFGATNVGLWCRTLKGKKQFDRMGRPGINTVLIGAADKDAFNSTSPRNDVATWRAKMVANLMAPPLSNTQQAANGLVAVLLPDILTYDTTNAGGFLNGRKLQDDVIDAALGLLSNNAVTTDNVGNDSAFKATFPYLADAN